MTTSIELREIELENLEKATGHIAIFIGMDGTLDKVARRMNRLTKGAVDRVAHSDAFEKLAQGDAIALAYPAGLAAQSLEIVKLDRRADALTARKAGVGLAKRRNGQNLLVLAGLLKQAAELTNGIALRDYRFDTYRTQSEPHDGQITVMVNRADDCRDRINDVLAVRDGVHFTRDLVSEPANVLTTTEFANRLVALGELGVQVEVLEEDELAKLGMNALLAVGQGSASPSKVVVMQWNGGTSGDAPLALVGKGVVFDTGGISLKPALGMEDMTMDMGGAGVVAGAMMALAKRKAAANVVGLIGLVENMPSGTATRPGDVVTSMKGDTIEITNTDAEGRLVLCDVMWYAQDRFAPKGMIDLATLTGAIIIGLGYENAGVFSNDDTLCHAFLDAARTENEGAWRLPLGQAYDKLLKSRIADMNNVGGRPAGSITAAQFLQRFVKDGTPWIHLDIAGVASVKAETAHAPSGATGWGVMALNRLVRDNFE
jgi:leucyl aminopeptidase